MTVPQNKHNSRWGYFSILLVIGLSVAGISACKVTAPKTTVPSNSLSSDATSSSPISTPSPSTTAAETTIITPASTDCTEIHGTSVEERLYSEEFDETIPITLYLPPCLNLQATTDQEYPTLYLIPGVGSDETQWMGLGLAQEMDAAIAAGNPPFIVVMPLLPDPLNWPSDRNAIFITEEIIPYIDTHFPTYADRHFRAIGGLSRGAAWALRIGLFRSDSFGKIGLHSLPLYDDEVNYWANILGEMSSTERPALFMDSGKNDEDLGSALLFDQNLTQNKITHTWHMFDGDHNEDYWSKNLPIYLKWYAKGW